MGQGPWWPPGSDTADRQGFIADGPGAQIAPLGPIWPIARILWPMGQGSWWSPGPDMEGERA